MARSRATTPSVSSCEHDLTKLIAGIASRARQIFGVKIEHIHVDTTSFSVSGQYLREPEETSDTYAAVIAITYGYSYDHREDLKQWMLALATNHEGDIPTFLQPLDGNSSDKASLLDTISAIQRQLQETANFEKEVYSMSGWENFLVAQVGASAALAGLVFVGVSINLARILSIGSLPEYALEALVLLLAVVVISSLLLVPQPLTAAGIELLLAGIADTAILLFLAAYSRRKIDPRYYGYLWFRAALSLCATLPFAIAGIAVLIWNINGLYWIVPATLLSITVAIYNAWVLLVEINR